MRKYLLNKSLKAATASDGYAGFDAVSNVLVVYDLQPNEARPEIDELKKTLVALGKNVQLIGFKKERKPKEGAQASLYFSSDLTLIKKPGKKVLDTLPNSVDLLIDWTKEETSPNDFIASSTLAPLKVGIDRSLPCFAVVIQGYGHMPGKVIEEIIKYIKLINHA